MNTLNQGQQAAADGFFEFLFSNKQELIISGPGGVGKTFLMGYLIDRIMPRYLDTCQLMGIQPEYWEVAMTATTNKAAEVLGQSTRRPTKTIHSFLGLRVYNDATDGETKLKKGRNWEVHDGQVIFVDEASMIDSKLLKLIREGTIRSKIVYVGDHCQLAPVKETLSPIYREQLPFFELTQPMRNADQPALMEVCNQLRRTVETGEFEPIRLVPGVIDHLGDRAMEAEIAAHFTDMNNQDRILAYTNNRVLQYNDHIRELRGLPPTFTEGEHVINNVGIERNNLMMAVEDEFIITEVAPRSHFELIEPEVELEVLPMTLQGRHSRFPGVPVPVNKNHFRKLMSYYKRRKKWRQFFDLKEKYPDLRPRDAATVHKAQGSTYDTVFLDLDDLSTVTTKHMAARLLYVAFTRARKRVVMHGRLKTEFGGIAT